MSFMILSTLNNDNEIRYFVKKTIFPNNNSISQPSLGEFYDKKLFDQIEGSIANNKRNEYKIVCLGIFPSVLEYNGYHTLDSYIQEYPLSYKHQFREIISKELDKSEDLKDYFDNWGSRCYIFSSELNRDYLWGKERDGKVTNLEISTEKLKELDCSYIFSAVEIENHENLNLQLIGEYTTSESYWNIYVYKV